MSGVDRVALRIKLSAARHWLRVQLRDAIELFALPALAAILPWPLCFAIYKRLARLPWLYRNAALRALSEAQAHTCIQDSAQWLYQRKLVTLVDHADLFLSAFRSHRWMKRYVRVSGQWPDPGQPHILCTFHWGAGMWSLRHMRRAGVNARALAAPLSGTQFEGRPVLYLYARWRTAQSARELGNPTIDASASLRPVLTSIRAQEQIVAVVDVPADAVAAASTVPMLGGKISVPRGLLRLAAERTVAVTVFTVGIDLHSGYRNLLIKNLEPDPDPEGLIAHVFQEMEHALLSEPAAWHFWGEANRFFLPPGHHQ